MEEQSNMNRMQMEKHAFQSPETATLIKWQLDFSEELEALYHNLRGEEQVLCQGKDGEEFWSWQNTTVPLCNEIGAKRIILLIAPRTTKNTFMSTYTDEEIKNTSRNFMDTFNSHLAKAYYDYEIQPRNLSVISRLVDDIHYSALKRAKDSETLTFLSQAEKHTETYSNNPEQKKSGFRLPFKL